MRLETTKTSALLVYLAMQSRPQPRQKLIGLFWGDQPEASARRNLRHALWNIRQQCHGPGQLPVLLSDSQEIACNPGAAVWLDAREFEQCLKREREITAAAMCTDDRFALLRRAADLYCGDLLEGVFVDDAPEFEHWVLVERERLRAQMLEILRRLVGYSVEWGDTATGLDYVRRLLEMEPWLEEAHRQKMCLLAQSGQHSAAIAQYETCRRVLAEELDAEPSRETQCLYESIRARMEKDPAEQPVPRRKLPPQTTPFVGREEELARIAGILEDPACRLVTLVGPGGIGKTRLAVRAAAESKRFQDGIYFVPLAGVASSNFLASALADALGVELHGGESPQKQVVDALREKELLLLMDNFEHLLDGAEWLADILDSAPGVKILATSRERLNLSEEWLVSVDGLCYPSKEVDFTSASSVEPYAAVQLFVQGAQRARLGYVLTEGDQPFVVRLCQLVDGMPLAIELAANWMRLLSCQEVAARLEKGADFLTSAWRDLPARHRSMRAVFEQSWQLLPNEERDIFKRISVFRGGFRQEAAESVAGATLNHLAALVDKSFLRRTPAGRYEVHELLRQYAAEKLNEAEAAQAREAHGLYFAQFLATCEILSARERLTEVLEKVAEEIENIRASWEWMVQQRRVHEIGLACYNLHYFYELRSWVQEGEAAFERAAAALSTLAPEPEQQSVLTRLYNLQGIFCNRLSRYTKAVKVLETSLSIARRADPNRAVHPLANLATTQFLHGAFEDARQLLEEALVIYRQLENWPDYFLAQSSLGYVLCQTGNYQQARVLLDQAMEAFQSIGMPDNIAFTHCYLGLVAQGEKDTGQAIKSLEKGLSIFRELGHAWGIAACLASLSNVVLQNGEYDQAECLAKEGLIQAKRAGSAYIEALCLNCFGQKARVESLDAEATSYHRQAIRTAWEAEQLPPVLDGVIGIAQLELKRGQTQLAGGLLAFVIQHPSTCARERDRAEGLFAQLESQLAPEAIAAAQTQSLEAVVEGIFAS